MLKQQLLFLFGCIPVRLFIVYLVKNYEFIRKLSLIPALLISITFMYLFISGKRKTGPEVFGGKIWWNSLRPIHSILWFTYVYSSVINKYKNAWIFLFIDTIFGLISHLIHHYL